MMRRFLVPFLGVAVLLAVWQIASSTGLMSPVLVPPPSTLPLAFWSEVTGGMWLAAVANSFGHYAAGVAVGTVLGTTLGVSIALWPKLEAAQAGVARILRPIPPLAWIPFAIIWFGVSETAAAFIVAIGVFWLNYFAAASAVQLVDKGLVELARAFGHGGLYARLTKVILPAATPGILIGFRQGLGQGWMTMVAAELFGIPGIGQRMMEASGLLATDVVLLYMLTIALLYAATDVVFQHISNRLLAWTK